MSEGYKFVIHQEGSYMVEKRSVRLRVIEQLHRPVSVTVDGCGPSPGPLVIT
jgi:hypothetical protein